jgi:hypothetical protein
MAMRGRFFVLAPLAVIATALAACSGSGGNEKTPVACLSGPEAYLTALDATPEGVRLAGSTAISDCLVSGQEAGELATAGRSMVVVATRLNAAARREPGSDATAQLGYLAGAVHKGASRTGGIHADLVRRIDQAPRFSPGGPLPPLFQRTFDAGYAAGQADG